MSDDGVSIHTAWVLVIEDLRDQAELWSDICANAGLNSTTVATGIGGYRRACEIRPAIILLDLMLPDVDGWEVCRQLRADDRTKSIAIVILTARDEPHGRRRAEQAGCAAYLTKPCPPPELVSVLKRVLLNHLPL
jgi:CheY-like chemotaxis protein